MARTKWPHDVLQKYTSKSGRWCPASQTEAESVCGRSCAVSESLLQMCQCKHMLHWQEHTRESGHGVPHHRQRDGELHRELHAQPEVAHASVGGLPDQ